MSYHSNIYSCRFHPLHLQIFSRSLLRVRLGAMKVTQTKIWSERFLKKMLIITLCEMYSFCVEQSMQA